MNSSETALVKLADPVERLFGNIVLAEERPATSGTVIDRMSAWTDALLLFLSSRKSENTRVSYERSLHEFLAYTGKMPWDVGKDDVAWWVESLYKQGRSKETVNLRVAAVSSFYSFCMNDYEITLPDGRKTSLAERNPAASKSLRSKVVPYGKATSLGAQEARALLAAIKRCTVQGLRDYALFLTYLFTARRNTEVRLLRWGHIITNGSRIMYRWSGKGKENEKYELPLPVWTAMKAYLKAAGRLDTMGEDDFIFTPLSDHATRFENVAEETWDRNRPLSMRQVGALLKKYARRAGLDAKKIHVHTLRHTGAMLRLEAGDSIQDVSEFLAHSSLAVTQIYIHRVEGKKDKSWVQVEALLGLGIE